MVLPIPPHPIRDVPVEEHHGMAALEHAETPWETATSPGKEWGQLQLQEGTKLGFSN